MTSLTYLTAGLVLKSLAAAVGDAPIFSDKVHPTALTQYAIACVHYASLTGITPLLSLILVSYTFVSNPGYFLFVVVFTLILTT